MQTNVPVMVGWRYVRAKRRNQFISFISGFSLIGMAIGVMALIIVMSVLNGFDRQIKDSILKVIPHGTLSAEQPLADWREWATIAKQHARVEGVAPFVKGVAVLSADGGDLGVEVQGILPSEEIAVSAVAVNMRAGDLGTLQAGAYNIILGRVLASNLFVTVGDTVRVTTPQLSNSVLGPRPVERSFTISGVFETGGVIDQSVAIIHIEDAKKIFRVRGGVQGLRIKVDDIYRAAPILKEVAERIDADVTVQDWSQTQGSLFKAVKQEKILVGILQMTIIAIAALNIVTGLVLMVADKRADIAVLRTMGLTARQVMGLFIVQGTSVGVIGLSIGVLVGTGGALYFTEIFSFFEDLFGVRMFDPNIYYTSRLPSEVHVIDIMVIGFSAFFLSLISTLYPAFRASQIAPAEALRYE
jgi:lipoprotein-releasing system permease protein